MELNRNITELNKSRRITEFVPPSLSKKYFEFQNSNTLSYTLGDIIRTRKGHVFYDSSDTTFVDFDSFVFSKYISRGGIEFN